MKINFTQKQYLDLVKLLHLGEWVANSYKIPGKDKFLFEDTFNYVLAYAKEMGCEELFKKYKNDNIIEPDDELDHEIMGIVDEYDKHTFWDELSEIIERRIISNKYSEESFKNLDKDTAFSEFSDAADKANEFMSDKTFEKIVRDWSKLDMLK